MRESVLRPRLARGGSTPAEAILSAMRLHSAPPDLARTREALHAVAERVLAPARVRATGTAIALEATPGGFGTPPFPGGGRVRAQGAELVVEAPDGSERQAAITTLRGAARLAGLDADELSGEALDVDRGAADFLGDFYAFATAELESLRANAEDPSPIHLWPEHFDVALRGGRRCRGAARDLRSVTGRRGPPRALPLRRAVAHARAVAGLERLRLHRRRAGPGGARPGRRPARRRPGLLEGGARGARRISVIENAAPTL
jgi:hypothetical protein